MTKVVWWGTAGGIGPPAYYAQADVTSDGGQTYGFRYLSSPLQPDAQGGQCVFFAAHLALQWSASAVIRVTPVVDGATGPWVLAAGRTLEVVRPTFALPQQVGGSRPPRAAAVWWVPLLRATRAAGQEELRHAVQGQRLQLLIESTGALGTGELILDGIEVDYEPLRKSLYPPVTT